MRAVLQTLPIFQFPLFSLTTIFLCFKHRYSPVHNWFTQPSRIIILLETSHFETYTQVLIVKYRSVSLWFQTSAYIRIASNNHTVAIFPTSIKNFATIPSRIKRYHHSIPHRSPLVTSHSFHRPVTLPQPLFIPSRPISHLSRQSFSSLIIPFIQSTFKAPYYSINLPHPLFDLSRQCPRPLIISSTPTTFQAHSYILLSTLCVFGLPPLSNIWSFLNRFMKILIYFKPNPKQASTAEILVCENSALFIIIINLRTIKHREYTLTLIKQPFYHHFFDWLQKTSLSVHAQQLTSVKYLRI